MRIALTVGSFNQLGGIERVTVQLALGYRALGHDVTVFATDWDPRYEDRFTFERVDAPTRPAWLRTLRLPAATSRLLAGKRFDFVHGQGTSTLTCDLLTFHSVHAAWLDVSVQESGAWSPRGIAKRLYPFHRAAIAMERRQVATHRGMIHACSAEVRDEVIRYYGADPARVVAVPWGIELDVFQPDGEARQRTREAWGVTDRDRVLLLVANEFNRKGLGPTLEAMAALKRAELKLMVAGRGDPAPFQARIDQLGLRGQVHFLGHVEVAPAYQAADLFVMPSTYEGWGLVIGEALAAGLPVVTSKFPGSLAMVAPGENGLLIDDPRDADALAYAIEAALTPSVHTRLVANARPSVLKYGWPEVCRQLLALGASKA
ncbi:Lipopolysaccharide core biosynthesis protein RfaG [compost metagenome]